ncbi:endothelial zinc finger protein induced by tumor necrosis factor alpha-like [Homalodisca vitripennis]|uniref:endothelial zinc finger protein induced by tumor necrosis factor alpha-like n=1 Tax=Homalodisca vitripennis TaxID=197043 RepID=UPI001EEC0970|nr:endothelial zinc finger protein induced by tumor necrosis factor alpha-like [Homalodisca vitripennis]
MLAAKLDKKQSSQSNHKTHGLDYNLPAHRTALFTKKPSYARLFRQECARLCVREAILTLPLSVAAPEVLQLLFSSRSVAMPAMYSYLQEQTIIRFMILDLILFAGVVSLSRISLCTRLIAPPVIPHSAANSVEESTTPLYACSCGKIYRHMTSLQKHQRLRCGDKPPQFPCGLCMKHSRSLVLQEALSDGQYVCPSCGRVYRNRCSYTRHYAHECGRVPPYACTVCGKSFMRCNSQIYSEAVYVCSNCPRKYRYPENLSRHLRYECGVEPRFSCPQCSYKTKHRYSLTLHLRRKHASEC